MSKRKEKVVEPVEKEVVEPKESKKRKLTSPSEDLPKSSVLCCGSNEVSQLGEVELTAEELDCPTPRLVKSKPLIGARIATIAVGGMHNCVVVYDKKKKKKVLYTYGCGDDNCLGREFEDNEEVPGIVEECDDPDDVTAGEFHTLVLKAGRVTHWGGYKNQSEFIDKTLESPTELPVLEDVVRIRSGYNFGVALTKKKTVYQWGFIYNEQRVTERNKKRFLIPRQVKARGTKGSVVDIFAGGMHAFILTSADRVLGWGYNQNSQLGFASQKGRMAQEHPKEVPELCNKGIIFIGGGLHYSIALAKDGTVYSFGEGKEGVLGHGNTENCVQPTPIEYFTELAKRGDPIVSIHAGDSHCLAISSKGALYAWGFNVNNQLGTNDGDQENPATLTKSVPCRVSTGNLQDKKVLFAQCGGQHSLIVVDDNKKGPKAEKITVEARAPPARIDDDTYYRMVIPCPYTNILPNGDWGCASCGKFNVALPGRPNHEQRCSECKLERQAVGSLVRAGVEISIACLLDHPKNPRNKKTVAPTPLPGGLFFGTTSTSTGPANGSASSSSSSSSSVTTSTAPPTGGFFFGVKP